MARPLRIEHEGAVYHVMSRGNRAEFIFGEDSWKEYFIEVLERTSERYDVEVYAYCIMGNHYHLLVGVPLGMLSRIMHIIQSSYGSYIRRTQKWIGHVFAGRYKSLCVEKENYLLQLSRYIHLNPVREGIARAPEEYFWSSYRYYAGQKKPDWLKVEWLLSEYGKTYRVAQRKYVDFVEAAIGSSLTFPGDQVVGQAILGGKEFVREVVEEVRKDRELKDVASKRYYLKSTDLNELYGAVCGYYEIKEIARGREGGRGRDMFVYLAKEQTMASNAEIGQMAGGITFSAVAQRYARTARKVAQNRKVMAEWTREAKDILSRVKG